jgi:hypothetical protein
MRQSEGEQKCMTTSAQKIFALLAKNIEIPASVSDAAESEA